MKYNVGDMVEIINNSTCGFGIGSICTIYSIDSPKIGTYTLKDMGGSLMWHPPEDFKLFDFKKLKKSTEKCYMCDSHFIYNPNHKKNEVPICMDHYIKIMSSKRENNTLDITGTEEKGIIKSSRTWGIELESHAPSFINFHTALATLPKFWGSTGDGTIRHEYGQEIKTNPMKGLEGEKTLISFLTTLTEKLGWDVTPTCGTHCHIGVPEYKNNTKGSKRSLRNLIILYTVLDPVIRCLLPKERRQSHYCMPLGSSHVGIDKNTNELHPFQKKTKDIDEINLCTTDPVALERMKNYSGKYQKYYGISFNPLRYKGTIEIRYHEGTLDPMRLIHWISLHTAIIDICMNNVIDEAEIMEFAKIMSINVLFEAMLNLLNKHLDPSTVEYTKKRFKTYSKTHTDDYIKESRYDPNAPTTSYERPPEPEFESMITHISGGNIMSRYGDRENS